MGQLNHVALSNGPTIRTRLGHKHARFIGLLQLFVGHLGHALDFPARVFLSPGAIGVVVHGVMPEVVRVLLASSAYTLLQGR